MKPLSFVLLVSLAFNVGCQMPGPFTVMSFNVRYGSAPDGENRWDLRKELVKARIEAADPDIIAVQEPEAFQVAWLDEQLEAYDYVGVGRDDGVSGGEHILVMFKRDRFSLVNSGHFWMSETPDEPGSMGWDATYPRITQWAILSFNESPLNRVRVMSTHFDHRGKQSQIESAKQLRKVIEAQAGKPMILAGDFNCGPKSKPYKILTEDRGNLAEMFDPMLTVGKQDAHIGTYHPFNGSITRTSRIDWVLHNRRLEATSAYIDRWNMDGRYPSDHYPIVVEMQLKSATRFDGM